MARFSRGGRVTQVNPWIVGGEGQLRDLFPINPYLLLTFRAIRYLFKHLRFTLLFIISLYLWIAKDWAWWQAFIIFPALLIITALLLRALYLWYRNPAVPIIARKST